MVSMSSMMIQTRFIMYVMADLLKLNLRNILSSSLSLTWHSLRLQESVFLISRIVVWKNFDKFVTHPRVRGPC